MKQNATRFENGRPVLTVEPKVIPHKPQRRQTPEGKIAVLYMRHLVSLIVWLSEQPDPKVAVWAAAVAHGNTAAIGDRSMADIAKSLGVSRDTLSRAALDCCRTLSLPISPYMRGVDPNIKPEESDEQSD